MKKLIDIDWSKKSCEEIDSILTERIAFYEDSVARNNGKPPKRQGYVIERIACIENLRDADIEAQAGKVRINRFIRRHNEHAEEELRALQLMILNLDFPPAEYTVMTVMSDAGKVRDIAKQKYFPWRILHHAIMRVVGPVILKHLINDTFACIKGKGLHFGVKRMNRMLRRYPEFTYFVKTDYKKFYQSIPHALITRELSKRFKDEHLFKLINLALFSYDSGEEFEQVLLDEEKKKRSANRFLYKSADRQFLNQSY